MMKEVARGRTGDYVTGMIQCWRQLLQIHIGGNANGDIRQYYII